MSSRLRYLLIGGGLLALVGGILAEGSTDTFHGTILQFLDENYFQAALRATVPIAFAAIGGIFAEKTGVINIGLEGLLIISAFSSVWAVLALAGLGLPTPVVLWGGFAIGVLSSVVLSYLFAVICIEYKADQIIAGLAVWLLALGLAPFLSLVIWDSVNSPTIGTFGTWTIPVLSEIPVIGPIFFSASPPVYFMLLSVPLAWYFLYKTAYGRWMRSCGENPKAADTAGIDVHRVRYVGVLLSGLFSGIGGASFTVGQVGTFVGSGETMINGRGWIAITAYLFGNYNPVATFGASFFFAALDAIQIRFQQIPAYDLPESLVQIVPYVAVIVALALVGKTRLPDAAGEPYDSDED